uniref:Ornithine decarboxylase n=1 Tax=Myotis lucifugus TaxID=59463 RepID=G1Q0J1_MYOLU
TNNVSNEEFGCHFLDEGFTAKDILDQKINEFSSSDDKDAFYVADVGDIPKKHLRWLKAFYRVTPYAVKCNDCRTIVKTRAAIGMGLDCASKTEIQLVQNLGVSPERITYANPYKQASQIKYAANNGVQVMTFHSKVKLMKAARAHPKAKLVLRIATDDSKVVCCLSVKFGARLKTSRLLLEPAKVLNIDVISVSFHVGSGCTNPETFVQAISDAHCVFDMRAEVCFNMYLLNIGDGSTGSEDAKLKFEEITSVINPALDKYFPSDSGVTLVAEPGRYYVASAFTLAVTIIAKNWLKEQTGSDDEDELSKKTFMYYEDGRVHGSCNRILYDYEHMKPLLQKRPKPDEKYYLSSIWGPICDGLNRIFEHCGLSVRDWMLFENMGAYTMAAASTMSGPTWQLMLQVQNRDFPPDAGALPVSCAWESGMERLPAACISARINV